MTNATSPGWYPDPSGVPGQRYFDGQRWTDHRAAPHAPPVQTKSKTWLWATLAAVVLLFGGCATLIAIGSSVDTHSGTDSSGSIFGGSEPAAMNTTVSDGKFSFRVTNVERSRQGSVLSQPKGEYVIVTMTVTNTGNEPQTFFANNQKLFDAQGREYTADSMAAAGRGGWMEEMNPGFSITAQVPFDVPPGTQVDRIELHDSAFSGGIAVKLY